MDKTNARRSEKHVELMLVVECYETGLPSLFSCNGLLFHWYSWVVCEVENRPGNCRHHVMMTGFRCDKPFNAAGLCEGATAARWNPTYEDDEHREDVRLDPLHYWRPVSVAMLEPGFVL